MKRKITILAALLLVSVFAFSQTPADTLWTKTLGGSNYDAPDYKETRGHKIEEGVFEGGIVNDTRTRMAVDDNDNIYIATSSRSSDGDVKKNYGGVDAWILKLNSDGDTLWTVVIGGSEYDLAHDIVINPNGGCVVVGITWSDDGSFINTGHHGDKKHEDGFVAFIDKNGTIVKLKQYGAKQVVYTDDDGNEVIDENTGEPVVTGGYDGLMGVTATADGNFMAVGYSNSYTDDLGPIDETQFWTSWFLKFDSNGKKLTSYKISEMYNSNTQHQYSQMLYDVEQAKDGNFVGFGYNTMGNLPFFNWFVKTDGIDNENKVWSEFAKDNMYSHQPIAFTQKENGNFVAVAYTTGLDRMPYFGGTDVWVYEIDGEDGGVLKENVLGGSTMDTPMDIITLKNGNVAIVGMSNSSDNDAFGGYGDYDGYLLELDENLDTLRMHKLGGSKVDRLWSIAENKAGDAFYLVGSSYSDDYFVNGNKGGTDLWISKIAQDPTLDIEEISVGNTVKYIPTAQKNIFNLLNANKKQITIYNALGKQVMLKTIYSDTENINLQSLSTGMYLMKFNDYSTKTIKFLLE